MTSTNAYRRGVGYYKDLNEKELDAAEAKASKNDEEIVRTRYMFFPEMHL